MCKPTATRSEILMPINKNTTHLISLLVLLVACSHPFAHAQSKFVTTKGKQIVTPEGKTIILKGIGLGNWLLPEGSWTTKTIISDMF